MRLKPSPQTRYRFRVAIVLLIAAHTGRKIGQQMLDLAVWALEPLQELKAATPAEVADVVSKASTWCRACGESLPLAEAHRVEGYIPNAPFCAHCAALLNTQQEETSTSERENSDD